MAVLARDERGAEADRDELRRRVHRMWAAVAGSWGVHAAYVEARGADVTAHMLELAAPAPGEQVLELACGAGAPGLAAAPRVLPGGKVVLSDVAEEMTAIAAAHAAALGLEHVSTKVLDLEAIDVPDASYDVVLCREGLMFAVDPVCAAREIARVLRPGGRLAVAVWGPRAQNPWLALVFDAVSAQIGKMVPPPGVPGPFSLDDAGRLVAVLRDGGLRDVTVSELSTPARSASFDEWWSTTRSLAGPLSSLLEQLPPVAQAALTERVREAVRPYETAYGIEIPGLTLVAGGTR
jgi:SAM-dependent methyltransferase